MILSITGFVLIILPISAVIACALSLGNKIFQKLIINKYDKYKKQYDKDEQTIKSFLYFLERILDIGSFYNLM